MQMQTRATQSQPDMLQFNRESNSYYVELSLEALDEQGCLLDSLIQLAFDTPHLRRLDLRIVADPAHRPFAVIRN